MGCHHEIHAGDDGGKAGDKNAGSHRDHMRIRVSGAVRRVKRPPGIHSAVNQRPKRQRAAGHKNIPAHQVEPGKRNIARADHHRQDKIPEHSGDGWNEKEPDHQHAVNGEKLVVSLRRDEFGLRRE